MDPPSLYGMTPSEIVNAIRKARSAVEAADIVEAYRQLVIEEYCEAMQSVETMERSYATKHHPGVVVTLVSGGSACPTHRS